MGDLKSDLLAGDELTSEYCNPGFKKSLTIFCLLDDSNSQSCAVKRPSHVLWLHCAQVKTHSWASRQGKTYLAPSTSVKFSVGRSVSPLVSCTLIHPNSIFFQTFPMHRVALMNRLELCGFAHFETQFSLKISFSFCVMASETPDDSSLLSSFTNTSIWIIFVPWWML